MDVDLLYIKHAVINEGPKLKRFMPAAMGRATPIQKRTSHVEIVVAPRAVVVPAASAPAARAAKGDAESGTSSTGRRPARTKRAAPGRARSAKRGH